MLYSSTRGTDNDKNFIEVMLNGLAKDGGLYVPNKIPYFSKKEIENLKSKKYYEIAYEITKDFVVSNEISKTQYKSICKKTYNDEFNKKIISIKKLAKNEFILNLYHGPTLAFKDYALQLLGNLYEYVLKKKKTKLTIIGATSGDTGSAAIYGCSKSPLARLFILFPKGKVSEVQRKQMTTFKGANVTNIEVNGNFNDCQKLVKDFFKLNKKKKKYNLAAINSINWVRIIGQVVYYFWAYLKVEKNFDRISFAVPTGNFGNVYAGFISKKMGLPIDKLLVCSNKNDILYRFLSTGKMKTKKVFKSLSPSMDIQVSSNFERLLSFFVKNGEKINLLFDKLDNKGFFNVSPKIFNSITKEFIGGRITDKQTREIINYIFKNYNHILDPHTAVGYAVGKKLLNDSEKRVYMATAHYSKFMDTITESIFKKLHYPSKLKKILKKKECFLTIDNDINQLEKIIEGNK